MRAQQKRLTLFPDQVSNNALGFSSRNGGANRKTMIPLTQKYLQSPVKGLLKQGSYLSKKHVFDQESNKLKINQLKRHLAQSHKLQNQYLKQITAQFQQLIHDEPNLLKLQQPITLIGDIHGQFDDLLKIMNGCSQFENDPKQKILFLGDYVDRGINSTEVMILLMLLKITKPNQIFMLRGNHQSKNMAEIYNFKQQCCEKYNQDIYERIVSSFDSLPIAATVNDTYFCVHGGLSQKLSKVDAINKLHRFREVPPVGLFCDLLWSDPTMNNQGLTDQPNQFNNERGCSVLFNKETVNNFLLNNQFKTVIRAHEVYQQGFRLHQWNGKDHCPPVITIFSAPNYCGCVGNLAAILRISNSKFDIRQYRPQKIRNYFSQRFQVFAWSIPQWIRIINQFSGLCIDKIYENHIPEGANWSQKKKLAALLQYQNKKNSKNGAQQIKLRSKYLSSQKSIEELEQQQFQRAAHYNRDFYPIQNDQPKKARTFKSKHEQL